MIKKQLETKSSLLLTDIHASHGLFDLIYDEILLCSGKKNIYVVFVASMMYLLRPGLSNLISIVLCAGKAMNAKSTLL